MTYGLLPKHPHPEAQRLARSHSSAKTSLSVFVYLTRDPGAAVRPRGAGCAKLPLSGASGTEFPRLKSLSMSLLRHENVTAP